MRLTILAALLIGAMRIWMGFNVPTESFEWLQVYKDVAHLFMGGLFVAWRIVRQKWQKYLFVGLCALEIVVAVASRA